MLRKALRRAIIVVGVLCALAGAAYAGNRLLLSDDVTVAAAPLRVDVLKSGTFKSSHPYAPYYVVARKRFASPSELSRLARNKLITRPSSALSKGAMAGSPQVVRLRLRATGEDPVTLQSVRFRVVSDASPVRGWFTTLPGCMVEPVRLAQGNLDASAGSVRYVDESGKRSTTLAVALDPAAPQVIELHAATKRRRVAWTAQLTLRDKDGRTSTVAVDDGGEPFRVTSVSASQGYEPVYGVSGIRAFKRSGSVARRSSDC